MIKATWSGYLSVGGMFNIPIKFYSAIEHKDNFKRLCECGGLVGNRYKCNSCGKDMDFGDWYTGYDLGGDNVIRLNIDEIEAIKPIGSSDMQVLGFVHEVDPLALSDQHYFIGVAGKKSKSKKPVVAQDDTVKRMYVVFRDTLRALGLVAIGKYVDRGNQHYVCIRAYKEGLLATKLIYADYRRSEVEIFEAFSSLKSADEQLGLMQQIVAKTNPISIDTINDEYSQRLQELVNKTVAKSNNLGIAVSPHHEEEGIEIGEELKEPLIAEEDPFTAMLRKLAGQNSNEKALTLGAEIE